MDIVLPACCTFQFSILIKVKTFFWFMDTKIVLLMLCPLAEVFCSNKLPQIYLLTAESLSDVALAGPLAANLNI